MMADEGGAECKILAYGPGYWLWLVSIFLALASSALATMRLAEPPHEEKVND